MARSMNSEQARETAAARRIVWKKCGDCGHKIFGTARRRYCSDACRVRAVYHRARPTAFRLVGGPR
jgi:uncharacterized OB-fold protein